MTSCGAYQKPRAPIVAVDDVGGAEPQAVDSGRCRSAHRLGIHLCAGEKTRIGRHAEIRRFKRTASIDFTAIARGPSGIRIARRATDTERARGAECCARTSRHDENANAGIVPPFSGGGGRKFQLSPFSPQVMRSMRAEQQRADGKSCITCNAVETRPPVRGSATGILI